MANGLAFLGWYDNPEFTGSALTSIPAGWEGTLYAKWTAEENTDDIKWELNGGSVSVTLPSKIEGSAYTLPTPVKEGYVFVGWSDGTNVYKDKYVVTENKTLVATYEEGLFKVTFKGAFLVAIYLLL